MNLTVTEIVMGSATIALLLYDVYAIVKGGIHNTISWTFVSLSKKYPAVPFFLGLLCGHLIGQMK